MTEVILALDFGSTNIKATALDGTGRRKASASVPAPRVEAVTGAFDADEYLGAVVRAIAETRAQLQSGDDILGLSAASQRATLVLTDETGRARGPALSWQGISCAPVVEKMDDQLGRDRFRQLTGLLPSTIFPYAKLAHLREEQSQLVKKCARVVGLGEHLISRLSASEPVAEPSSASATGLWELARGQWSEELLKSIGLTTNAVPRVGRAGTLAGGLTADFARETGLAEGTPFFVGGGDQQCAVLGSGCEQEGELLLSLGTAASLQCLTTPLATTESIGAGLLALAHVDEVHWILEGFHKTFGSAIDWAARALGLGDAAQLQASVAAPSDPETSPLFVPFLAGIGTPEFDDNARGSFLGLTLEHGPADLARAVVDGVALETRRILGVMSQNVTVRSVRAVGGGARQGVLGDTLAELCGVDLTMSDMAEAATQGAAAIAWTGVGKFDNLQSASHALLEAASPSIAKTSPPDSRDGDRLFERYLDAIARRSS